MHEGMRQTRMEVFVEKWQNPPLFRRHLWKSQVCLEGVHRVMRERPSQVGEDGDASGRKYAAPRYAGHLFSEKG